MKAANGCRLLGAVALLVACSDSTPAAPIKNGADGGDKSGADAGDAGSAAKELPAELRDLEQASEDLIAVSFGELPDRKANWNDAEMLHAALKQRWFKAKANVKGLPSAAVKVIDAAIKKLDTAVPAHQQQETAEGAIEVFSQVPDLFALFPSAVPSEVVHMDALGMQIAVEAHFENFSSAGTARKSLGSDWDAVKSDVSARVDTCTRVQDASTIVIDFEAALKGIDTSIAAKDGLMTEQYAENVLVAVDTLQLLFNCPIGDEPPANGLGSRCKKASDCDSDQVCDSTNNGGRCAPDPARVKIGDACTDTAECGKDRRIVCASEAGDNFPGGYCLMEPCDDIQVCPPGSTCVTLGDETPQCFKSCESDADCRTSDGYVCQFFLTTPPEGFGPSSHACSFPCTRDFDCLMPLTCDVASGKCKM